MSYTEARAGGFALYSDIVYAPLGIGISRTRSFGGVTIDAAAELDIEQLIIEAGGRGRLRAGSEFSWNVIGAYSFEVGVYYGVTVAGVVGYRALAVDFERGSGANRYDYDVVQHGPLISLTARF